MAIEAMATDQYLTVNGLRLHYLEWGRSAAPTIIMLHGLRGYAHTWDGLARELVDDFHILALDQRGRGESDWDSTANYTRDAYVADLESFVEQLGLERFILVGHSMGGANTLAYTTAHPDRVSAAIIEDMGPATTPPAPGTARIGRELDATPSRFASWADTEVFVRQLRPGLSDTTIASVVASSLKELPDGQITWKYDLDGIRQARQRGGSIGDLWPCVRGLQCPTLVLRGGESDILAAATAQAMADANPNVSWVEIPGASHFVHDDQPAAFNRAVTAFLSRFAAG